MESTEEIPTAAVEPWRSRHRHIRTCTERLHLSCGVCEHAGCAHLSGRPSCAHEASVLLGFEGVGCFCLFTFSCVWRSGGRCGLSDNWKNSPRINSWLQAKNHWKSFHWYFWKLTEWNHFSAVKRLIASKIKVVYIIYVCVHLLCTCTTYTHTYIYIHTHVYVCISN